MTGWEGIFGMLFTLLIMAPAQFMGCPFDEDHCSNGKLDDFEQAFEQLGSDVDLSVFLLIFTLASAFAGGCVDVVTKHTSAATRTLVEQSKVFFVWMFFMGYQGPGHETFSIQKLGGFVFVIVGVLFFEEILAFEGYRIVYDNTIDLDGPKKDQDNFEEPSVIEN